MIGPAGILAVAAAFFLSLTGTVVACRVAGPLGFVDRPRGDRHHGRPTPLLGGSAILLAVLMPCLLGLALATVWRARGVPAWLPEEFAIHVSGVAARALPALGVLAGAVLLHAAGLIDDRRGLGPWVKLLVQVAVATAVVTVCRLRLLEVIGEPLSGIATVVWIVVIINAFNFLDNIDGLAAGVAAICAAALLAAAAGSGQLFISGWLCVLLGASAGFLVHNFPPASIFMGDAGSMVLGYFLAVASILTTYYHGGPSGYYFSVFAPVVLMAVPLYDTIGVVALRLAERRNPMVGDTRHFSHRLLRRGMSPRKTVLTIYLATGATAAGASLLPHVRPAGAVLIFAQTVGIVLIIALLESARGGKKP